MTNFRAALSATAIGLGLLLTGCGGATSPFLGTTVNVSMTPAHVYNPVDIPVPAGGRVIWTNLDSTNHTVTSDTPVQGLSSDVFYPAGLRQGDSFQWFVPANAVSGTKYYYHCRFHGTAGNGTTLGTGMAGSVTVQ